MKEKIRKFIFKIVQDALWDMRHQQREQNLAHTADLARFILDCKNNNLTLQSRAFIMRMNIHPDEFLKKPIN